MDNRSVVSPSLVTMATADGAKIAQRDLAAEIATQQSIVDAAFEARDYSRLAIASQLMLKLQNEQSKAEAHKLESKLLEELVDMLEPYSIELQPYNELRCFISGGEIKSIVLLNVAAQAKPKATATKSGLPTTSATTVKWLVHGVEHELPADIHGKPTSESLLRLAGEELLAESFVVAKEQYAAGKSFNAIFEQAKKSTDAKNAVYQARKRLLKHVET